MGGMFFVDNMSEKGLPSLENDSVALTFTSPPYWNYIEYASGGVGCEESYEDYLASLEKVFREVYLKTFSGGRLVVNVSNVNSRRGVEKESFLYPIVPNVIEILSKIGFVFFDEIIWDKKIATTGALGGKFLFGSYPYALTPKMMNCVFDDLLVFVKSGKRPKVDKLIKEKSRISIDEWRVFTRAVWQIHTGSNKDHPATFPIELAERVIRLYSFVGDVVLDPFAGVGTTVKAAKKWDRVGIGFEISEAYKNSVGEI